MTAEEVVDLIRGAPPFQPFELHLSDNRSYVIEHPEFAALTGDRKTLIISIDPDEDNNFQTTARIDLRHIVSVTENSPRRPSRRRKKAG